MFRLELPPRMRIHDVFHTDRLRRAPMNPLPGQEEIPEPPMEIKGEEKWEVLEILVARI